jgi:antirestriction protein ArdC
MDIENSNRNLSINNNNLKYLVQRTYCDIERLANMAVELGGRKREEFFNRIYQTYLNVLIRDGQEATNAAFLAERIEIWTRQLVAAAELASREPAGSA